MLILFLLVIAVMNIIKIIFKIKNHNLIYMENYIIPNNIFKYGIYDIFHNDINQIVIIVAPPHCPNISYMNDIDDFILIVISKYTVNQ